MNLLKTIFAAAVAIGLTAPAHAEAPSSAGALVVVPAFGAVTQANDQAVATLAIEEQDRDKAAAASRVNQKMRQGMEIVRREDPRASLKTQGYYSYPVYPDARKPDGAPRAPVGWRVGQTLQVTTTALNTLPRTVAAAQGVLTLNALQFGLSPATLKQLDDRRIAATWQNLSERVAAIAAAMGRKPSDAVLDTLDFEASGAYAEHDGVAAAPMAMRLLKSESTQVQEPSFEAGETTLQMRLVGKLRFK